MGASLTDSCRECLIEIGDDVVDMLDSDTQTNRFRADASETLLLRRHLAVSGRGRVTSEGFCISEIHETLE